MQTQPIKKGRLPPQLMSKAVDQLEGVTILDGRVTLQQRLYFKSQKGSVYKAYDKMLQKQVAVKVYQRNAMDNHDYKMYKYEVQVMKEVKSPNTIQFIEECDIQTNSKIYLVMEYCEGVTLYDYYCDEYQKPEAETLTYLVQILQGLYALHVKNFVHRDLKLENIMVCQGKIKIIDYGFSKKVFDDSQLMAKSCLGTLTYQAPEILRGEKYNPFKSDIFSLGVMLYLMQQSQNPFQIQEFGQTEEEIRLQLADQIRTTKPNYPVQISKELRELIDRMLEYDPIKRITLSELLQHPLLTDLLSLSNMRPDGAKYIEGQETLSQYAQFYKGAKFETVFQHYSDLVSTVSMADVKLTDEQEQQLTQSEMMRVVTESNKRRTRDIMLRNIVGGYEYNLNVLLWLSKIFYNYQRSEDFFNLTQHQVMALLFQLIVLEFKSYVNQLQNDENTFLVEQEYWLELLKHEDYQKHKEQVIKIYFPIVQSHEQILLEEMKEDDNIDVQTRELLCLANKEDIQQALTKRTLELVDQFNQYRSRAQKKQNLVNLIANNILFYLTLINPKSFFAELKKKGPFNFLSLEEEFKPKMQQLDEFLDQASSRSQQVLQQYSKIQQQQEETEAE